MSAGLQYIAPPFLLGLIARVVAGLYTLRLENLADSGDKHVRAVSALLVRHSDTQACTSQVSAAPTQKRVTNDAGQS